MTLKRLLEEEHREPLSRGTAVAAVLGIAAVGALSYVWGRTKTEAFAIDVIGDVKRGARPVCDLEGLAVSPKPVSTTAAKALVEEATFRASPFSVNSVIGAAVKNPVAGAALGSLVFGVSHAGGMARKADAAVGGGIYSGVYALGDALGGSRFGRMIGLAAATVCHTLHNVGCDHGAQSALVRHAPIRTTGARTLPPLRRAPPRE